MGIGDALKRRAVFLDRDGVINRAIVADGKPYPPASVAELEVLPGVADGLEILRAQGFELIVVTNQPDVARGKTPREAVEAIHERLRAELGLETFLACYHDDADGCACRKPKPGFMLQMRDERGIVLAQSYLVGDRWRDVAAGRSAGCRTVFIDYGYNEPRPDESADHVCASLLDAAQWIASQEVSRRT